MSALQLPRAVQAWGTPDFAVTLKAELESTAARQHLPLQAATALGSHALDDGVSVMLLAAHEPQGALRVRVGVFFNSIVAGCNCADDPTPVEAQAEYCEVLLEINMTTAATAVVLAD